MAGEKYFERHQYAARYNLFCFVFLKIYLVFYQSNFRNLGFESKAFLSSLPFTSQFTQHQSTAGHSFSGDQLLSLF